MKPISVFLGITLMYSITLATESVKEPVSVNEFIVKAPDAAALEKFVEDNGLSIGPLITYPNPSEEVLELFGCYYIVTFPDELREVQDSLVEEMEGLEGVEYVEPNEEIKLEPEAQKEEPGSFLHMPDGYIPNDPLFDEQWNITHTQTNWAWPDITGEGVIVAIIDSGVDTDHEDLVDNLDLESSYNFYNHNNNVEDLNGHGTWVTGVVGMKMDNNKGGVGVAPECIIWALQAISGSGAISNSAAVEALIYAADNGADVANMSFGGSFSQTLESAVNYAWGKGVFIAASAGNDGTYNPNHYPSSYENVMAVGATCDDDSRQTASNYGSNVDIFAPGWFILTTSHTGEWVMAGWTSVAAPHISGLAALIQQKHPEYTNQQVWDAIINGADSITLDVGPALRINTHKSLNIPGAVAEQPAHPPFITAAGIQQERVSFAYSTPDATDYTLSIYDVSGREVYARVGQLAGSGQITYNPMSIAEGVYFWKVKTSYQKASGKFVWVR